MKFGGTSVGDIDRMRHVAHLIAKQSKSASQIVVVVSAMAGETNRLYELSSNFNLEEEAGYDERDVILAAGEQVSCGLLSLALREKALKARSCLGWQAGIFTNDHYGMAQITGIETKSIENLLKDNQIIVVAGFQGINSYGRVATLGRGGSDLSAVALAAALKADRCDIYTDVDGVYTTDPRIEPKARKLDRIAFEEMLEMSSLGAKVLQPRSVILAMNYGLPLRILSSFLTPMNAISGTLVCHEDELMETRIINGVAYSRDESLITISKMSATPKAKAEAFKCLGRTNANIDMIVQSDTGLDNKINLTLTVNKTGLKAALKALEKEQKKIGYERLISDENVAKVSIVGIGMRSHTGVAETMFSELADKGINVYAVSTSEIKISVLIDIEYVELAVRILHSAFDLA